MASTLLDPMVRRDNYSGIYWSIAIAVLFILAFTWAMRPRMTPSNDTIDQSTLSPGVGVSIPFTSNSVMMDNNTAMDSYSTNQRELTRPNKNTDAVPSAD